MLCLPGFLSTGNSKTSTDAAEPLPAFGVKQAVNSPLDFGPYASEAVTLSTKSWPGQRPAPAPNQEITLLVNDMNGAKIPVRCRLSDPAWFDALA